MNRLDISAHPEIALIVIVLVLLQVIVLVRLIRNHHIDKQNESPAPDRWQDNSPLVKTVEGRSVNDLRTMLDQPMEFSFREHVQIQHDLESHRHRQFQISTNDLNGDTPEID